MPTNTQNSLKLSCVQTRLRSYDENLQEVLKIYANNQDSDILLFPELCLTGFDYANLQEAVLFSQDARKIIQEKSSSCAIAMSLIVKDGKDFYNEFVMFKNSKLIHSQRKHKLFKPMREHKHFAQGNEDGIKTFELDGVKIAVLICFELRFSELWQRLKDAQIILVCAQWPRKRADHLAYLLKSLAIVNQCFVMCANVKDNIFAGLASVTSANGKSVLDQRKILISSYVDLEEIEEVKRKIPKY